MIEQYQHLSDKDLKPYLEKYPIDEAFGIPLLTDPEDILEMYRMLINPKFRKAGLNRIEDFYQITQDGYNPLPAMKERIKAPYCVGAEGKIRGEGWTALVYRKELSNVAVVEEMPVKEAVFDDDDLMVGVELVDKNAQVMLKRDWNFEQISEPNGCYFDEGGNPHIVSPPVIAMYYHKQGSPHFFYDKRRLKREGSDEKARGFVWRIRPAKLDAISKVVMKRHIDNN